MAYLGRTELKSSDIQLKASVTISGSSTNTVVLAWTAPNEQSLILKVNGVVQHTDAYSIAGSPTTITLASGNFADAAVVEVVGINDIGKAIVPADSSVTVAKLATTGTPDGSKFLQDDMAWADVPASGGFSKWTPVTASINPFDLQPGTTKVILEVQASGATAGTGDAAGNNAGSGASGAYAKKLLTGMTGATDKLDITIGAVAGAGASGNTTSVAQAGTATFATITCTGGAGGAAGAVGAYGGAGGALPTTGDLKIAGQNGLPGAAFGYASGPGSNSMFGLGGIRLEGINGVGEDATGYGAGGGQGLGSGSQAGGAGGPAIVIVWEYK